MLSTISAAGIFLLVIFIIAALIQLYYMYGVFGKFAFFKPQPSYKNQAEPLSVIIAARNEHDNLMRNLPAILNQDYPDFEVVVVNDCSWDSSQSLLEEMQKEHPRLKVCQLVEQEKYPTGKKFAITIGVKAAKHDLLVFTDADCEPASDQWLRLMQSRFTQGKEIVLGYSPYKKEAGFLNRYIRFETLMTALFYFSRALMNNAFMGVGRNMAYRKELFFRYKGFASHQHILSGDDDLFVNETATATNVAIETDPASFVFTDAKKTYESWSRQKSRHMTTGKHYKGKDKVALGLYYASLMLFYGSLIALLIVNIQLWPIVAGIFALRFISQEIVFYMAAKKLKCVSLLWSVILMDFLYVFYLLVFGTKGLFARKRKRW